MEKEKTTRKRIGLRRIKFWFKYGVRKKRMKVEEFQLAGEYLLNEIDKFTMEKDLLLRGLSYKNTMRILDAYEHLRWLSNIPEPKPITTEKLKGGILDGIRGSQ